LNSKVKKSAMAALLFCALSIVFIFLLKNVDVVPVGAYGSVVGLSSINRFFYNLFGLNMFWYKLTNYPGMAIDVFIVFIFAVIGLNQWIKRKSILKVDKSLFVLGVTYAVSLVLYVLFEKFVINYRPVILPGKSVLEPSFPSSHTMLTLIVVGTAIMECARMLKNLKTRKAINVLLYLALIITILGRMISGVHWFTDILGGIFIGSAILAIHCLMLNLIDTGKIKNRMR